MNARHLMIGHCNETLGMAIYMMALERLKPTQDEMGLVRELLSLVNGS